MKLWVVSLASFAIGVACTFSIIFTLQHRTVEKSVGTKTASDIATPFGLTGSEGTSETVKSPQHPLDDENHTVSVIDCYVEKGQPSWLGKWNPSCRRGPLSQQERPLVSIVTAFNDGHLLAAVELLQSLIVSGYQGHLGVYLLLKEGQKFTERMKSLPEVVGNTSLAPRTFFGTLESNNFMTYCFKAQVIQDYLYRFSEKGQAGRPQVLIWADAHIQFRSHPEHPDTVSFGAQRFLHDNMHFGAPGANMGMVESTHPATFDFLEVDPYPDYLYLIGLCSCLFMVNMNVDSVVHEVLNPFLHCGVNACRQCMTPIGTSKKIPENKTIQGAGGTYLAHRQDQSVLGILAHEYKSHHPNSTMVGEKFSRYLRYTHKRQVSAHNIEELLHV